MTTIIETDTSIFINGPVQLIASERDIASEWASKHIVTNPHLRWIVGKYVEADKANSNGQLWTLDDLRMAKPSISYAPMNLLHRENDIVGTYVGSELVYPTDEATNPFIETVGAFWKYYFPEELEVIEAAHSMGALSSSMECISDSVTCVGPESCGETFSYRGPNHASYCEHIREHRSHRQLNQPHFLAGALIFPPERPGWKGAMVSDISKSVGDEELHRVYTSIAADFSHLTPKEWEAQMFALVEQAFFAQFSADH